MKTSINGINLIKKHEACRLNAYLCPAKKPTIGYGNTTYLDGSKVKLGDKITQQQANMLLLLSLPTYERQVLRSIKIELNQNQFDALVSFVWNNWYSETLFKMINSKEPKEKIIEWWKTHYITGDGKVLGGLVKRRAEEAELFFKE